MTIFMVCFPVSAFQIGPDDIFILFLILAIDVFLYCCLEIPDCDDMEEVSKIETS